LVEEAGSAGAGQEGSTVPIDRVEDSDDCDIGTAIYFLLQWLEGLSAEDDPVAPPPWIERFQFPEEAPRAQELATLEGARAKIDEQLVTLKAKQAVSNRWKSLITADGPQLERAVGVALSALGFDIDAPALGRTDLRGSFKGSIVVVEVKGASKSAAEQHAAQLEKWVAAEHANGIHAKGILVVNAWRKSAPDKRRTVFPNQMLQYASARGHSLVSGLQLLALSRAVMGGALAADDAARLLMENVGILDGWDEVSAVFV
jgi:hypothetical protein